MTIDNIIEQFEKYGYYVNKSYAADLAWNLEQSFNKVPKEKRTTREELIVKFTWNRSTIKPNRIYSEEELDFVVCEDISVSDKGILYYIPGRMHYYYSFGLDCSRIYRDDELNLLMKDIHIELANRMGKDELRNIKLVDIGI